MAVSIQNFSVPQGDDFDITFTVDPADEINLTMAEVVWNAYEMEFGVPVTVIESGGAVMPAPPLISKRASTGGITVLESPGLFIVHLGTFDTVLLPTGNYYHEAAVVDASSNNATVCQGAMAITLALNP